ncbi:hypothetical protein E4U26_005113, partial [Claviceps purpurea]
MAKCNTSEYGDDVGEWAHFAQCGFNESQSSSDRRLTRTHHFAKLYIIYSHRFESLR